MGDVVSGWSMALATLSSPWALAAIATKFLVYMSSFLAAGLAIFPLALPGADALTSRAMRPLAILAIVTAMLASALRVMVQAGRLIDDGLSGLFDVEIIAISLDGPLGQSTYVRLIGLALLLIAVLVRPARLPATVIGALCVAGSFALTGHATGEPRWLLGTLMTFHLLAVSFWWGALAPLHHMAGRTGHHVKTADIAEQFGRQAMIIVPLLIAAGALCAWFIAGSITALFTQNYGRALLTKLFCVALILIIATLNKTRFVPALGRGDACAAHRFRHALRVETVLFALVFAVTAVLTTVFTLPHL